MTDFEQNSPWSVVEGWSDEESHREVLDAIVDLFDAIDRMNLSIKKAGRADIPVKFSDIRITGSSEGLEISINDQEKPPTSWKPPANHPWRSQYLFNKKQPLSEAVR